MAISRTVTMMGLAAAVALTLGACREEEQGRRVMFEPGVYKGKADSPISAETKRSLRTRVQYQNELAYGMSGGGGGAPASAPPNVRPPSGGGAAAIPLDALRQRTRRQNVN